MNRHLDTVIIAPITSTESYTLPDSALVYFIFSSDCGEALVLAADCWPVRVATEFLSWVPGEPLKERAERRNTKTIIAGTARIILTLARFPDLVFEIIRIRFLAVKQ
jgi:hypothetical protein